MTQMPRFEGGLDTEEPGINEKIAAGANMITIAAFLTKLLRETGAHRLPENDAEQTCGVDLIAAPAIDVKTNPQLHLLGFAIHERGVLVRDGGALEGTGAKAAPLGQGTKGSADAIENLGHFLRPRGGDYGIGPGIGVGDIGLKIRVDEAGQALRGAEDGALERVTTPDGGRENVVHMAGGFIAIHEDFVFDDVAFAGDLLIGKEGVLIDIA